MPAWNCIALSPFIGGLQLSLDSFNFEGILQSFFPEYLGKGCTYTVKERRVGDNDVWRIGEIIGRGVSNAMFGASISPSQSKPHPHLH